MDDHRADPDRPVPESHNSSEAVGSVPASGPPLPAAASAGDEVQACWQALIEFMLSRRSWWIDICSEFDLTPMQGHTLRWLDPDRPAAMSVLADALICDASNVTGIVDKLESRGLIVRQSAESDRRIKMLAVTAKGRELRERLCARLMAAPPALAATPIEFRRQLTDLLAVMMAAQAGAPATDPRGA